jgi:hypothetical protein
MGGRLMAVVINLDRIRELRARRETVAEPELVTNLLQEMRAFLVKLHAGTDEGFVGLERVEEGPCEHCGREAQELWRYGKQQLCFGCIGWKLKLGERIKNEDQSWRDRAEPPQVGWRKPAAKRRRPHKKGT